MKKHTVIVVDDQKSVRSMIKRWIESDANWEVIGEAANPYEARDLIVEKQPEVMTLDVHMPGMDGIVFLKKLLPQYPMPVIMFSSSTTEGAGITLEALEAGAFDYVTKPTGTPESLIEAKEDLLSKLYESLNYNSSHSSNFKQKTLPLSNKTNSKTIFKRKLILVGSSTGGTTAIRKLLNDVDETFPPILIAQHMPENFTTLFAQRLNSDLKVHVKEAKDKELLQIGTVYIAPGNYHLGIQKLGSEYFTRILQTDKKNGHRPSVDVLFESAAEQEIAGNSIAIILTGMGSDGASGLLKLKNQGCLTIGQNKETCVVYGMPKVAYELGAVLYQVPLDDMVDKIKEIAAQ
ncbi:chemotaxis response regulator protein-glutamate methylesterase [Leptospira sp. 2 VSF19]|uniref:Protein-glutamate methylesterase/protein-glutamine glutaminase n=1 Tax=Leptospira soteropolitanensis TaxID=2950025 RepID=A0AAW5VEW5_9LEPT|nr:chemotaxis response regulator protein-glutamate methylesterase [Leptospira soteropolitanensis]MCW7493962.1 chemotaxis response regulator protein-glutamate methylesterase [Leptospira soteropolitanensis]MCW7501556.1 chemotaxis response regulator protein-glutamate methylesterase [Leptospira soteropolitanensis]MCW7523682.1 chemotaxis response regulator protein-glutamate methylesterase [Leptospira soteropolitanensis]MCW7527545.1 chemotaxis response regulator protein-glutamate methylesterase [Lept